MAGCVISCESTCPVAFGQFSSNCPRLTAVCIAVGCLLARNWAWLVQPVKTSKLISVKIMNDFDMCDLLSFVIFSVTALVITLYRSGGAFLLDFGPIWEWLTHSAFFNLQPHHQILNRFGFEDADIHHFSQHLDSADQGPKLIRR